VKGGAYAEAASSRFAYKYGHLQNECLKKRQKMDISLPNV